MQSFRQRIYPNQEQQEYLKRQFGACRFVYNWALATRRDEWIKSKVKVPQAELGRRLTKLKTDKDHLWLNEVGSRCLFFSLMNLEVAFSNFFKKRAQYPAFKRRADYGGSAKFDTFSFKLVGGKLRLPSMKNTIRVNWTRDLPGSPKFVTVSQDSCGNFWAAFTCDLVLSTPPPVKQEVGIDLGITVFATLSSGEKIQSPDLERKQKRVRILQRRAASKLRGSNNRRRANRKVARAYQKVVNSRTDFQHKLSRKLVDENQVIAMESLNIKGMAKNHSLARSISEQSWYSFVGMLRYKAERAGRTFVRVDRWFPSSKTCHACGHVVNKLPLNIREWACAQCGTAHDRDINAAINILAAGRVVTACGADGRPMPGRRAEAVGCEARRNK